MTMEKDVEQVLLGEKELAEIVSRLAKEITRDYQDSPRKLIILSLLKGSLIFTSDLVRQLALPLEIDFMKVSSYGSSTTSSGKLKISLDLKREDLENADILVVEDIVDSGRTLTNLKPHLMAMGAGSVKICTLLDKPSRREFELVPDYCGAVIPDKFVIGYGLDYDERYRNLPYVGILSPSVYMND